MTHVTFSNTSIILTCTEDFAFALFDVAFDFRQVDQSNKDDVYEAMLNTFEDAGLAAEWDICCEVLGHIDPTDCLLSY